MPGLARFVAWRGREVEERCEPGAIGSRGRAVGVGLAFGLGGGTIMTADRCMAVSADTLDGTAAFFLGALRQRAGGGAAS
jgi:hypothetical protein